MTSTDRLAPATELAQKNSARFPNESEAYRRARSDLFAEEIELRRHIERVAQQRRELPPGGEVTKDYRFEGEHGPVSFADLFGDKDTLIVYSFMYGPQREQACPMCTALLDAWASNARHVQQRAALAAVARSPIERLIAFKRQRGWGDINVYSDPSGEYTRDYVSAEDADMPGLTVFSRANGTIRHFWSPEGGFETADPGRDPSIAPDPMPLWTILDMTPEGRGTDWYPKLEYVGEPR